MIFGISGYATAGKDSFADAMYSILSKRKIKCYRESFAKQLKLQMHGFLETSLKINSFTIDENEKNIIRPLLVAYGEAKRKINPNYWVETLDFYLLKNGVSIISDVRYENEADWILSKGGKILHLNRIKPDGDFIKPANKEEEANAPKVIDKCFYEFCWNTLSDKNEITEVVSSFVDTFLIEEVKEWKAIFPLSKE
jgi:hypothetical protein